jgi:peptidoglycan/xylan/chitin deacetylase (PgdA/CDA1 family)
MSATLQKSARIEESIDDSATRSRSRRRTWMKRMALAVDHALPNTAGVVVLAYHRVGDRTNSPVDMSASMFRRQLAHLAASANTVSLDEGLDVLSVQPHTSTFPSVLTFDDGTSDFVDVALPMLVEFKVPATLYLSTAFVDSRERYPADGVPVSWNGLREVVSTGLVTIAAHTHNHTLLDRCDAETARSELDTCNDRIAAELGIDVEHFAYPKALRASGAIEAEVRRRYRSAAVAGTRANNPRTFDPHRLLRSPIQRADGWDGFIRKLEGGMRTEDDARRMANRVRYVGRVK